MKKIDLEEANEHQTDLLIEFMNLTKHVRPRFIEKTM